MSAVRANCRIGRVTLKQSGLQIVRLQDGPERTRRSILAKTRDLLNDMEDDGRVAVGFALVIWDSTLASLAAVRSYPGSSLPGIAAPDFVRNRLLASKIEEWSRE